MSIFIARTIFPDDDGGGDDEDDDGDDVSHHSVPFSSISQRFASLFCGKTTTKDSSCSSCC